MNAPGTITTAAGNGTAGYSGDGSSAGNAEFHEPMGLALDSMGNLYVADTGNNVIREITGGNVYTIAGTGASGFSGDGGSAKLAQLSSPLGVATDGVGNLYISDSGSGRVRKVSADGVINTIAGTGYNAGYSGDGGPAVTARLIEPEAVAVDDVGNVYVADTISIRLLQPTNSSVLIGAALDGASQTLGPVSPGKVVVIYGDGMGPSNLTLFRASQGAIPAELAGTTVSFSGIAAPVLYTSATQMAGILAARKCHKMSLLSKTSLKTLFWTG